MNTHNDPLPITVLIYSVIGLLAVICTWQLFLEPRLLPPDARWSTWTLFVDIVWTHFGSARARADEVLPPLVAGRWPVGLWVACFAFGVTTGIGGALCRRHWEPLLFGIIGWACGGLAGWMILAVYERLSGPPDVLLALLAIPGLSIVGAALAVLFGSAPLEDSSVLRGAQIKRRPGTSAVAVKQALKQRATAFGGAVLTPEDEVSHFLAAGVTRVGKSLALRELLYTSLARGDRAVVADPDGGAMKSFHKPGDVILNPYDDRSVKWDILAEIESAEDYANLAASLLPLSGSKDAAQWEGWARDIFAACLHYWHENDIGTSDEFTAMLATASNDRLALLCEGIEAARVFKPGMEKVLGSILQTLSVVIKDLRLVAAGTGHPFSVRRWVREGQGTLWMPYMAKQIPSLHRLVSVWMSLAVAEPMSMGESTTRRLWFIVDELDALGPIDRLDEALVRGGKFGVCVALGFQTIAQVQGAYGNAVAAEIVENCNTMLFLRCNQSMGGGTALFASECIGDNETRRVETSNTRTEGGHPSSSLSVNMRQQVQKAVLPSEITRLPKRHGYLKTQSDPDWSKVQIDITAHRQVVQPFVPANRVGRAGEGGEGATL